ncbi:MAG TPA: tetraacyldisaccharide 4'-kinase [Terracidiphilus sp.]|nr:tetraacyldisaccharide 4'-kinase [Terracidiphilus sp.]
MKRPWLAPLVPLYAAGTALRARMQTARQLAWPVISVGNLSTGGAGKTPLTIALARALTARDVHVDVLSRGYGRASSEPARVDPEGSAAAYGDEPLLVARAAQVPVYVAPRRYGAGLLAETDYAGRQNIEPGRGMCVHLLDDGFQHRRLARATDVVLLRDADLDDGLLPAGNLREPLSALERATVVAVMAEELRAQAYIRSSRLIWRLHRRMVIPKVDGPVAAFCGIARPEQFFAGLEQAGIVLVMRKALRDHHPYTSADIEHLLASARSVGAAAFITTEKDAVRLGSLAAQFPADLPLLTAGLTIQIEDEAAVMDWLVARLSVRATA